MDHKAISSKGGKKTLKKYGKGHFGKMGVKGGKAKLKMYGIDYFKKISALGVLARKKKAKQKSKSIVQKIADVILSN
jgi:hypothetical protein